MGALDLNISLDELRRKRGMKWSRYGDDVIPAWVADMDFPVAEPIREALRKLIAEEDLGYPALDAPARLLRTFAEWVHARHGWQIDPADAIPVCDVVQLMHAIILSFTEPGDGAIVQTPIYPPFLSSLSANGRRLDENPLVRGQSRYEIDFDRLEQGIDKRTRLLMLCNPHNPSGRAFTEPELRALAAIAIEHDLIVMADEIHMDLVYPEAKHIPFASLGPDIGARTITLTSATKGFNIAGTRCAVAHFGSPALRRRFEKINLRLLGSPSAFGMIAAETAWRECDAWHDAVLRQLDENRRFVAEFIDANLPGIGYLMPEATYLAWLDCGALNLPDTPAKFFLDKGRVALSPGSDFSSYSKGYVRLNFATPPDILRQILTRMATAVAT